MRHLVDFHQTVDDALADLFEGRDAEFALDENSMVSIAFPGDIQVTIQAMVEARTILIWAEICRIVGDGRDLIRRALDMNFFQLSPVGAFTALDRDGAALVLCLAIGEPLPIGEALAERMASFVSQVEEIRRMFGQAPTHDHDRLTMDHVGTIVIRG